MSDYTNVLNFFEQMSIYKDQFGLNACYIDYLLLNKKNYFLLILFYVFIKQ